MMQEIFKQLQFRPFSYEEDPESITDMHCCAEVLEGSWFDKTETCQMHSKIVVRAPGSSWVVAYNTVVFAHADLVKQSNGEAHVIFWRIHESYNYPEVAKIMLDGLKVEAQKRGCSNLIIFADQEAIDDQMESLGLVPDRKYMYVNPADVEQGKVLRNERVVIHENDIPALELRPFIGNPLPPDYLMQRAYLGADYAVFKHTKPDTFEIYCKKQTFLACHDGREWFVFKKGDFKVEPDMIASVLKTIASLKDGLIMLSEKAMELAEMTPTNHAYYNDYCIELGGKLLTA